MLLSRGIASAILALLLMYAPVNAIAQDDNRVWTQSQMTEEFMRRLTKWECVEKTRLTLSAGCSASSQCMKTMAGLLGDCVTYATGDIKAFCESYPRWRRQSCFDNKLDGKACVFFEIGEKPLCRDAQNR